MAGLEEILTGIEEALVDSVDAAKVETVLAGILEKTDAARDSIEAVVVFQIDLEKCIRQHALNVVSSVKFLSNQHKASQFIAKSVS